MFVTQHQQLLSGRGAISRCTFSCLQYMYLYYVCALRSDFGHVWLLTTLVYILKLLYVNSCVVWSSYILKPFYSVHCMYLYIFLLLFVRRIVPWILLGIMRHRNVHYYYYKQTETDGGGGGDRDKHVMGTLVFFLFLFLLF